MEEQKKSSGLGGGLWIIPVGLALASIWSFIRTYIAWKSGSAGYVGIPPVWTEDGVRVNITSIGAFWFGVALLLAAAGSFYWMKRER